MTSSSITTANDQRPQADVLTSRGVLVRSMAWNLIGTCAPIIVAVFAIPILTKSLGIDRFGVLALSWAVVGYFGLFDLGLGRAVTKIVAEKIGTGELELIAPLFWTSFWIMSGIALLLGLITFFATPLMVNRILNIPPPIRPEAETAWSVLALGMPFVITTTAMRGLLEAQQRFRIASAIRIPFGALTYAAPVFVLPFSRQLPAIMIALIGSRVLSWVAHLLAVLHTTPALSRSLRLDCGLLRPLFQFGTWMTVSNVLTPLISTLDRFLIGSLLTVTAVAYYATPAELVTRVAIIPSAVVAVLFPAFSTAFAFNRARADKLFLSGVKFTFIVLLPTVTLLIAFAPEGLRLWLGKDFAEHSYRVLQWLSVGILVNSLGYVPFAAIQGVGKPKWTGLLHLTEIPFYALLMWFMISRFGIEGAAMAWTVRVVFDTFTLFVMSHFLLPGISLNRLATLPWLVVTISLIAIALLPALLSTRVVLGTLSIAGFLIAAWFYMLSAEDRALVSRLSGTLRLVKGSEPIKGRLALEKID